MSRDTIPALRLGVVPYLNVQPLIDGLEEAEPSLRLIPAPPRELDRMLEAREIDLGILPILAAFQPGRAILRSSAICSEGPVLSVCIFARKPIDTLKRIEPDPHSLTSNALAALLLKRIAPNARMADSEVADWNNAGRVVIGDQALRMRREAPFHLDLAEAWKDWVGLPFVFAAWIGREGLDTGDLAARLDAVYARNLNRLNEIAAAYAPLRDLPGDYCETYLRAHLTYRLGDRESKAVERFHSECAKAGLIEDCGVRWMGD